MSYVWWWLWACTYALIAGSSRGQHCISTIPQSPPTHAHLPLATTTERCWLAATTTDNSGSLWMVVSRGSPPTPSTTWVLNTTSTTVTTRVIFEDKDRRNLRITKPPFHVCIIDRGMLAVYPTRIWVFPTGGVKWAPVPIPLPPISKVEGVWCGKQEGELEVWVLTSQELYHIKNGGYKSISASIGNGDTVLTWVDMGLAMLRVSNGFTSIGRYNGGFKWADTKIGEMGGWLQNGGILYGFGNGEMVVVNGSNGLTLSHTHLESPYPDLVYIEGALYPFRLCPAHGESEGHVGVTLLRIGCRSRSSSSSSSSSQDTLRGTRNTTTSATTSSPRTTTTITTSSPPPTGETQVANETQTQKEEEENRREGETKEERKEEQQQTKQQQQQQQQQEEQHKITHKGDSVATSAPSYKDTTQAYNPVIFFSLSLSIFATVGVVIFVRNCVRCPPAHELIEGGRGRDLREIRERQREDRRLGRLSKSPTPIPVLYSLVSEEGIEEEDEEESPSQLGLHNGTEITPLDSPTGTPSFMTPDSATPTGDLDPTERFGGSEGALNLGSVAGRKGLSAALSLTPSAFPSNPVSYAVTKAVDDVVTIATTL